MTRQFGFFVILLLLCACSPEKESGLITKATTNSGLTCQIIDKSSSVEAKAIYGIDNRLDWFEAPGRTKEYWARATVAIMPRYALIKNSDHFEVQSLTYEERIGLCPGNPFGGQPTPGVCSGFLVSDDLVATAGHCVVDASDCRSLQFVFDFAKQNKSQSQYRISEDQVYGCKEIVQQSAQGQDFAIIRLDRKVSDRTPVNLRRQGVVGVGEQVMLIGHPMGLPSKIADGGVVQSVGSQILASVDAFAANSGSPVFNSNTGLVEGILVAGEPDFKYVGGCRVEAVCGANCSGEVITPISTILPYVPDVNYQNPICD